MDICRVCKIELDDSTCYEYRGATACEEHFDEVIEARDFERSRLMDEEHKKTDSLAGLDLGDSVIGNANKKLLARKLEISSKESKRLFDYERPKG